jgi:ubiquitin C-terminal hydrolase
LSKGLGNYGNTCYINSALQCLLHTPPLANFLLDNAHSQSCRIPEDCYCAFCDLENLALKIFKSSKSSAIIYPKMFFSRLKQVAKHFCRTQQEDTHEYLRLLIDSLQESCLHGYEKNLEDKIKETSFIHQVFGGYLRSQIKCLCCGHDSNSFETILDLSLNVQSSVEKSLRLLVEPEILDKDNLYYCEKCARKVPASKSFSIHVPPRVLCLHLKRFDFRSEGKKIKSKVIYGEHLDLSPFLSSNTSKEPVLYQLYGVLVHDGLTLHSGHYHCYVRGSNQLWQCIDDELVSSASIKTVLHQQAYLLFYIRIRDTKGCSFEKSSSLASLKAACSPSKVVSFRKSRPETHTKASPNATDSAWVVEKISPGSPSCTQKNYDNTVVHWDEYIKDVGTRTQSKKTASSRLIRSWDGSFKQNIFNPGEQKYKFQEIGPAVTSWEGGPNSIDTVVDLCKFERDEEDELLDKGKLKKARTKRFESLSAHFSQSNPFQLFFSNKKSKSS